MRVSGQMIVVVALSFTLFACRGKNRSHDQSPGKVLEQTVVIEPSSQPSIKNQRLPPTKTNGQNNINDDEPNASDANQNGDPREKLNKQVNGTFQQNLPFSPLSPPVLPPFMAPPLSDDDELEEEVIPVLDQCGNGVVNKIVNRIECRATDTIDNCRGRLFIEECDDNNTFDNDGCSSSCLKECCGNGIVEEGEQCDVGQDMGPQFPNISPPADTIPTAAVPPACSNPTAVTDVIVGQEVSGTSLGKTYTVNCSRHCQLVICGDGIVNGDEQCDDGNDKSCDGCTNCFLEKPGSCPCSCNPGPS